MNATRLLLALALAGAGCGYRPAKVETDAAKQPPLLLPALGARRRGRRVHAVPR